MLHSHWQVVKFLLVGGINTLFGYSVFALFIYLDFQYFLASFFSTMLSVLFNFKTIGSIVFQNKNNRLFFRFITVYLINYLLSVISLKFLLMNEINLYYAGAIITLPLAIVSFILNKVYVFSQK